MNGRRLTTVLVLCLSGLGLAYLLAVSLAQGMGRELIHDEHQFVAPGALLAQRGLFPYVDYPYFHMPYLAFLYGGVFLFTDHLLLGARAVSVAFGWLMVVAVFYSVWFAARVHGPWVRGALAGSAAALLFFSPFFLHAHALTWNHDGGVLFATLALLRLCRSDLGTHDAAGPGAAERDRRNAVLAGVFLAVATGIRLSYATFALPFAMLAWCLPNASRTGAAGPVAETAGPARWRGVGWLALGGVLGSLPIFVLMAMAPGDFFFGNLGYPQLNTEWYASEGTTTAMTVASKLSYLASEISKKPGNAVLMLASVVGLGVWMARQRRRRGERASLAAGAFLCVPFALAGAFAPSPGWPQYYVAVVPFLVLGAAHALSGRFASSLGRWAAVLLLLGAAGVSLATGRARLVSVDILSEPASWAPMQVHEVGQQIGRRIGDGLVFGEAPIFALEGGSRIYGFHAVGPFSFRTGHLLTKEERLELGVYAYGELPMVMKETPPDAILTGNDGWMAKPTRQFAIYKDFVPFNLKNGFILFFRP